MENCINIHKSIIWMWNQMEAYFEQWPFKLFFRAHQGPPFRLASFANAMDHTRARGFAHNLCKFSHHKSTNETPDCSDGSRIESTIQVIRKQYALFILMPVWKMQERKRSVSKPREEREREKTFTRQLIFTKQEESTKQSVIVFLGCHTINRLRNTFFPS